MTQNEAREIRDLIDDYNKTDYLLKNQRWEELQNHLLDVQRKHCVEVAI